MISNTFLFVSGDVIFEESSPKGARLLVTMLELNKVSQQGTEYRIEEGDQIAASLIGNPIYYGTNWKGKHNKRTPIGVIESAKKVGNKIKGVVLITAKHLIEKLKKEVKFLFSVGGTAQFTEVVKKGGRFVRRMFNAICNHLQIVPATTKVGFPNARIERLIEINETVLLVDYDPIDDIIEEAIINAIPLRYI